MSENSFKGTERQSVRRSAYCRQIINSMISDINSDEWADEQAESLRRKIRELPDTLNKRRNCIYISSEGTPDSDGKTPDSAWDSLETLEKNRNLLKPGDTVLFRRGDCFRGNITAVSGVSYGAYGEGEKPKIYGSLREHINDGWFESSEGIWTLEAKFPADVGNIVFDGGIAVGVKKTHIEEVVNAFDFWCDHRDGNRIYIKLDSAPAKQFKSIEIAYNLWLFRLDGCRNVQVENLAFSYTGGHGIRASEVENVTVTGCEFSFIGGSFLSGYKNGDVRYGNAVEFMRGCKNSTVKNCSAFQIYDSGITHQGYGNYRAENITFEENLLEYCGMGSIEYWLGQDSKCVNVTYRNNIMRFSGYGFGGIQRPDKYMTAHIQSNGACINDSENFVIENNIFALSTYDLINAQSKSHTPPILKNNIYIQSENGRLGSYSECLNCYFSRNVKNLINQLWYDEGAQIRFV